MMKRQAGFTLVEIAIVLVIVGLILGGVLKGQEMIANAKVRNVIDQTTAIQTAVYAFQDRYRALPGDYSSATTNIPGASGNGNGNGQIAAGAEAGRFWNHLGVAGFITGTFDGANVAGNNLTCGATTCPTNPFGGAMKYFYGNNALGAASSSHQLRMGGGFAVDILAEIDRKVDDGMPAAGSVRVDTGSASNNCALGNTATDNYDIANEAPDCAGVRIN